VPLTSAKNNEIYVIKPIEDSECWSIIDFLKAGKSIIINLEGMNVSEAQHIIDIIVGSCYTIEGSIKRISDSIFVAAPSNTEVSGDVLSQVLMGDGGSLNLKSTKF
jgi:cell division inhibitor SepF